MKTSSVNPKLTVHQRIGLNEDQRERIAGSILGRKIDEEYLFQNLTFDYYQEYHNGKFSDRTFFIFADGEPVLVMWCLTSENKLGYFHLPARVLEVETGSDMRNSIGRLLVQEVETIVARDLIKEFTFAHNDYLSAAYFHVAEVKTVHNAVIDLGMQEEQIRSNVRKSYKSLLNWGQREMRTEVMDHSNADQNVFKDIRDFHVRVAGRHTRSDESWNLQFESLRTGAAFVVHSYFMNQLASAALILYGSTEAFYGVGVNDRELMKKHPVSHYPLYAAIMHAKKIGLVRFNMNQVDSTGDEKADNISAFKKGFTKTLARDSVYTVNFSSKEPNT